MEIGICGCGYVGLTSGACFAELGNNVVCIDIDKRRVESLRQGIVPIYEPGLQEMVSKNITAGRLHFSTDFNELKKSRIILIAVGTPPNNDGSTNLDYVIGAAGQIGSIIEDYTVIVNKSTVPPGTSDLVKEEIKKMLEKRGANVEFDVVSNPEFLAEGRAIADFMKPERIVIGTNSERAAEIMRELYKAETLNNAPIVFTDIKSAELGKYACNAMLATKISMINTIAGLCEKVGADVKDVALIAGSDSRIGSRFLHAGLGFGGSCFGKDIMSYIEMSKQHGSEYKLFEEALLLNMRINLVPKIEQHFGDIANKTFCIWGLSFKPETDDIRDAPSLRLINALLEKGSALNVYDPKAIDNVRSIYGNRLTYFTDKYAALKNADALIIVTEWYEFRQPDFVRIKRLLKNPVIFDGRNIYPRKILLSRGFECYGMGR